MDLYIYYRVPVAHAEELKRRVTAMQAAVARERGIQVSLKQRPLAKEGHYTWMEIYYDVPPEFEAVLSQAVTHAGLPTLIHGDRHTEYFMDVSSCA